MDHVGDHVVAAAQHCNATGRPQNGNQKDWHMETSAVVPLVAK